MVGRNLFEIRPVLRDIGIAIFLDPDRPGEQLAETPQVEHRHLAPSGAEKLRKTGEHVADEQPAVAQAETAQSWGAGDAAGDQVARDDGEIVLRALLEI